ANASIALTCLSTAGIFTALLEPIVLKVKFNYKYAFDLGECWKILTGLPFVYAVWLSHENVDPLRNDLFNQAISKGIETKQEIINSIEGYPIDLNIYFNENIQYILEDSYLEGMQLFLKFARELENSVIPIPSFF
ncbi:MAG: hypothetical protein KA143_12675, partial [Saprospiraceae bacterium]|nr:hypothetical protein [Saprospiraceae bacterium]